MRSVIVDIKQEPRMRKPIASVSAKADDLIGTNIASLSMTWSVRKTSV
jgi:hypothetical protein